MPTVETNGVETYYETRGEGPPVVFVHASMVDHSMWDAHAAALADEYTTVVYDLRGHGLTGPSERERYTQALFADDLRALLDALGLERPVLVGHSMGAVVAQTYAARHPDRLAGLVLADTFTPPLRSWGEWLVRRAVLLAIVHPVRLVGIERVERIQTRVYDWFADGARGDYGNVEALRESGPVIGGAEFEKVARAIANYHEETLDISAVTVPALVLYGENDLPFVRRHVAALAADLPDVRVVEVPEAGHAAPLDDPEFVTGAVRSFLAAVRAPESGSG